MIPPTNFSPSTSPIVSLIQARMSSSRLPGKVLMPLGGTTVLDQVVARAALFSKQVVVCTSVDPSDDPIEAHCAQRGVICIRGALNDVFSRFRKALSDPRVEPSQWFARITADCPLLSPTLAHLALEKRSEQLDYIGINAARLPRGLALELVRRSVFEALDHSSLDEPEREHVTLHLYETPGRYRCAMLEPPEAFLYPEMRLTLDYQEDYTLLERLFAQNPRVNASEAIAHMLADPALQALNADCVQKAARPV